MVEWQWHSCIRGASAACFPQCYFLIITTVELWHSEMNFYKNDLTRCLRKFVAYSMCWCYVEVSGWDRLQCLITVDGVPLDIPPSSTYVHRAQLTPCFEGNKIVLKYTKNLDFENRCNWNVVFWSPKTDDFEFIISHSGSIIRLHYHFIEIAVTYHHNEC